MQLPWGHDVIYFVTLCEKNRKPAWAHRDFFEALSKSIVQLESRRLWFVHAAVVMPDHLHLLATPMRDKSDSVGAFVDRTS